MWPRRPPSFCIRFPRGRCREIDRDPRLYQPSRAQPQVTARDDGPAGVVQLIRHRLASEYPIFKSIINLKGNHEAMMVQAALGGALHKLIWVGPDNGGDATVESYPNNATMLDDAKWLAALPTSFEDTLRCYVHAGIRPDVRLSEQKDADKLWIRGLFLRHKTRFCCKFRGSPYSGYIDPGRDRA